MRTVALTKESTKDILENLLKRSPNNYGKFESAVDEILHKVKTEGDSALFAYTKEFDKTEITADTIKVTEEEIKEAYEAVDPALIDVIRKALVNIRSYHEKQRQNSWFTSETDGTMLGQKVTALERVGVYVPGGKAVYPSSVLMNIVPCNVEKTFTTIHNATNMQANLYLLNTRFKILFKTCAGLFTVGFIPLGAGITYRLLLNFHQSLRPFLSGTHTLLCIYHYRQEALREFPLR